MKTNNLEIALREFKILVEVNDKKMIITYNNYKIDEMLEYKQYILGLYNDYFVDLRAKLETLMLNNPTLLLNFVESKITLFNDIKDTKGINNNRWRMYLTAKKKLENEKILDNLKSMSESIPVLLEKMIKVQLYYINKAINELTNLHSIYLLRKLNNNK